MQRERNAKLASRNLIFCFFVLFGCSSSYASIVNVRRGYDNHPTIVVECVPSEDSCISLIKRTCSMNDYTVIDSGPLSLHKHRVVARCGRD